MQKEIVSYFKSKYKNFNAEDKARLLKVIKAYFKDHTDTNTLKR